MQVFLVKNQQRIFRTNIYVGILPVFFPKLFAFIYDEVSKVAWCARNAARTFFYRRATLSVYYYRHFTQNNGKQQISGNE
jgi:hypothetical protein